MRLTLTIGGHAVPLRCFTFPGGEVQVRIEAPPGAADAVTVRADITEPGTLIGLLLLTDAVRRITATPRSTWSAPTSPTPARTGSPIRGRRCPPPSPAGC